MSKKLNKEDHWIVTDSCAWFDQEMPPQYNPYNPKRSPHAVQLVNERTGTIAELPSGSVITIVEVHDATTGKTTK